jgi:hypothetical protein
MKPGHRNTLIAIVAVVIAFGAGAAWQFNEAHQARMELEAAREAVVESDLQRAMERLEAKLAMATVAAQFGEFERGRVLASEFFDLLQEATAVAPESARAGLTALLTRRDDIITMLSRSEPQAPIELATLLALLQNALGTEPTMTGTTQPDPSAR